MRNIFLSKENVEDIQGVSAAITEWKNNTIAKRKRTKTIITNNGRQNTIQKIGYHVHRLKSGLNWKGTNSCSNSVTLAMNLLFKVKNEELRDKLNIFIHGHS